MIKIHRINILRASAPHERNLRHISIQSLALALTLTVYQLWRAVNSALIVHVVGIFKMSNFEIKIRAINLFSNFIKLLSNINLELVIQLNQFISI